MVELTISEAGLVFTVVNMFIIGIYEVVGMNTIKIAALNGLSGLGHIILAVGLVWTVARIPGLH